jgi:hypothetical protein
VDEIRIPVAGDPFYAAPPRPSEGADEAPHGCYDGWVYLGYEGIDENGEEVEVIELVPCQRCAECAARPLC